MRISPIALTTKIYRNNHTNKSDFQNNPILKNEFDTVSFKGKALSFDEVKPYRLEAFKLSNEASKHYEDSKEIAKNAYSELKVAKQAFKYTQSVLSIANKNPDEYVVSLENGNNLIIKPSFTPQGKFFTFVEVDQDSNPVRGIKYFGHNNFNVTYYHDNNIRDEYSFVNGRISVLKNNTGSSADCMYNFENGKLISCLVGLSSQSIDNPTMCKESYLFQNDELVAYSSGVSSVDNVCLSNEKYSYHNGAFVQYSTDFKGLSNTTQSWSSSYHFKDGKFVAYLDNVKYDRSTSDANGSSVIFLNKNGKYMKSSDFLCELTHDGSIVVLDNE